MIQLTLKTEFLFFCIPLIKKFIKKSLTQTLTVNDKMTSFSHSVRTMQYSGKTN